MFLGELECRLRLKNAIRLKHCTYLARHQITPGSCSNTSRYVQVSFLTRFVDKGTQGAPRFELGTLRSAVESSTTELYPPNERQFLSFQIRLQTRIKFISTVYAAMVYEVYRGRYLLLGSH